MMGPCSWEDAALDAAAAVVLPDCCLLNMPEVLADGAADGCANRSSCCSGCCRSALLLVNTCSSC